MQFKKSKARSIEDFSIERQRFTTPLSVTSQFAFCGLPLRLDSYAGCSFACAYCFARLRGGNMNFGPVRPADPESLPRIMDRAFGDGKPAGVLAQFLRHRVPVHFGGMSDPFQPAEKQYGVTASFLRALAARQYPTVISTRGSLIATPLYLDLLRAMRHVIVQFSFSTTKDEVAQRFEPSSSPPSELLKIMSQLVKAGIPTTCRWQPYITGVSERPHEFISRVAATGCKHLALEHLKVPIEHQQRLWKQLSRATGQEFSAVYRASGALRDGREYVLASALKLPTLLETAKLTRVAGMTFGAADNEFQYMSDTLCCCSGVDQFNGFGRWFKHQIGYALRKSCGEDIKYELIANEWLPDGSIDRFLNSKSRLRLRKRCDGTIREHIIERWNNPRSPFSPTRFYNVVETTRRTSCGNRIYAWASATKN
jgi:DNA repair photolyase